ncbi:uncharacterized protein AMSG_05983, partial [Thecamonas trahens ATCC 50062]
MNQSAGYARGFRRTLNEAEGQQARLRTEFEEFDVKVLQDAAASVCSVKDVLEPEELKRQLQGIRSMLDTVLEAQIESLAHSKALREVMKSAEAHDQDEARARAEAEAAAMAASGSAADSYQLRIFDLEAVMTRVAEACRAAAAAELKNAHNAVLEEFKETVTNSVGLIEGVNDMEIAVDGDDDIAVLPVASTSSTRFICPISGQIMQDPVHGPCGHHVDRPAILQHMGSRMSCKCPHLGCGRIINRRDLAVSTSILRAIRSANINDDTTQVPAGLEVEDVA